MAMQEPDTTTARSEAFERTLVDGGTEPAVAAELERRIRIIEGEEMDDPSRLPLTAAEITIYVAVSVGAVALGALLVAL